MPPLVLIANTKDCRVKCPTELYQDDYNCVTKCPDGKFSSSLDVCIVCHLNCTLCFGASKN